MLAGGDDGGFDTAPSQFCHNGGELDRFGASPKHYRESRGHPSM